MLKRILESALFKEFVLMVAAVLAVQLALGLNDLLNLINTSKDWGDLLASGKAWVGSFSFALFVTVFKQALVWIIVQLGGKPTAEAKLAAALKENKRLAAENIQLRGFAPPQFTPAT